MQSTRSKNKAVKRLHEVSLLATDCTILHSISYGNVEAWNLVTCYLDNAEAEGNDLLAHVESSVSDESKDVQAYFRKLGIEF